MASNQTLGASAPFAKQIGWIDEFGNLFPMGAWKPAQRTHSDNHKAEWRPVYDFIPSGLETSLPRKMRWGSLYDSASRLMAGLGYDGQMHNKSPEVISLEAALYELDKGEHMPGLMP